MNIFKVLANGYGNINENNVSAFLGYLLDPRADHGLNDEFLKLFLKSLEDEYFKNDENISFKNLSVNSDYLVKIFFEKEFYYQKKQLQANIQQENYDATQRIDIIIKISKKQEESNKGEVIFLTPQPLLIILLENKTADKAFKPNQIILQQRGLKAHLRKVIENFSNQNAQHLQKKEIFEKLISKSYSIYVTTDTKEYVKSFKDAINEEDKAKRIEGIHWRWKIKESEKRIADSEKGLAIFDIITDLFKKESEGSIELMNDITKHTLKAFKNFIASGFKSKVDEGTKNRVEFYGSLEDAIDNGEGNFSTMSVSMKDWLRLLDIEITKKVNKNKNLESVYTPNRIAIMLNGRKIWNIQYQKKNVFKIEYYNTIKKFKDLDQLIDPSGMNFYKRDNIVVNNGQSQAMVLDTWNLPQRTKTLYKIGFLLTDSSTVSEGVCFVPRLKGRNYLSLRT